MIEFCVSDLTLAVLAVEVFLGVRGQASNGLDLFRSFVGFDVVRDVLRL